MVWHFSGWVIKTRRHGNSALCFIKHTKKHYNWHLERAVRKITIRKMTLFGTIFEVNSSIDKLWDFLERFDEKGTVWFLTNTIFLLNNSIMLHIHTAIGLFLPEPCDNSPVGKVNDFF